MDKKTRETVESIVRKAGDYLRGEIGNYHPVDFKGNIHIVTEADRKSEEMIQGALLQAFPRDDLLAEESGLRRGGHSDRLWLIDPLDGTTNYAHGYPFFAISVALEVKGRIVYGIVYDPMRDEFFTAEKGRGATLNQKKIAVSSTEEFGKSLICTGFPYDIQEYPDKHVEDMGRVLHHSQGIRRDGSAALDLCYVACGRYDGFYERKLSPWDTAAGMLIAEEAGGRVTTIGGDEYSIYGEEILATNGRIHDEMVRIIAG